MAGKVLLILFILLITAGLAWVIRTAYYEKQRQTRLILRMRKEAERQERAVVRLAEGLNASMRQVNNLSAQMEARQDRMSRTLDERMNQMQQANDQSLEKVRQTVSDKLDGRLNESFRLVNAQLANVHRGLGEMREITTGMTDLKKMLGGVKTRGVWGEVQLRSLMSQLFSPGQYIENAAIPAGGQQRVEFALKLPMSDDEERLLPIDSKFPQEDYLRLLEAEESGDRENVRKCAAQLERAVLEQARRIHDKYIMPPQTADFAVMFLPTESLYAEVARREGLIERTQEKYRVLISGPATFSALLTSMQMGFRSLTLERRSGEVLKLLAGMKQDFVRFEESIQRMRQRLTQTGSELDTLETRARKVVNAIDNVEVRAEEAEDAQAAEERSMA